MFFAALVSACSVCGHVSPANRPTQAVFHCQACGHTEHADTNAAGRMST
ncbi:zinc ribbon domain-containing protein [Thiolapillus sp.]